MTPQALFDKLCRTHGRLVLRRDTAEIAHLSAWLAPGFDHTHALVLNNPMIDLDAATGGASDRLVIRGDAVVCNVPTRATLTIQMSGGEVAGLSLVAPLPDDWHLTTSFSHLSGKSGVGMLDRLRFTSGCFVFAANCGPVTDPDNGLNAEIFVNGLNVHAGGLRRSVPASMFEYDRIGGAKPAHDGAPNLVKMHIAPHATLADISMQIWWPETDAAPDATQSGTTISGLRVLRAGWRYGAFDIGGDTVTAPAAWLWKVVADDDDAPFEMITAPGRDPGSPPTHISVFPTARFLTGGAQGLASYADGMDVGAGIPSGLTGGDVNLALAASEVTPGVAETYSLVVMDRASGQPFTWQAVPDLLSLTDINVTVTHDIAEGGMLGTSIRGIAEIDGYTFLMQVDAAPGQSPPIRAIRGELNKPHEINVEALLEGVYGHPVGLPNLQIKLLQSRFERDFGTDTMWLSLDVGGHVDLSGNGMFVLEQIGMDYATANGAVVQKEIRGKLNVATVDLAVRGSRDAAGEWLFEARADPTTAIALDAVLDDLLHRLDLAVPQGLPKVELTEFGLGYYSISKNVHVWGRAEWTPPEDIGLPWHPGPVHTVLDVTSRKAAETGERTSTVDLSWSFAAADDWMFSASAQHDSDSTTFFVDWVAEDDNTKIDFNTLSHVLNLEDLLGLPDFGGWSLFKFSEARLGYRNAPREIVAATRADFAGGELLLTLQSGDQSGLNGDWTAATPKEGASPDIIGLSALFGALGSNKLLVPPVGVSEGMFDFTSLSLEITRTPYPALTFTGAAASDAYREVFVNAMRQADGWGFVAGVSFDVGMRLGDLPILDDLLDEDVKSALQALIPLEPSFVLVSTMDLKHFVPPISGVHARAIGTDMPEAGAGMASRVAMAASAQQNYHLSKGVMAAGKLKLADASNPLFALAHDIIGLDELDATIELSATPALMARIPGTLRIPLFDGEELVLRAPYLGVRATEPPTVAIGGDITLHLFGDVREADLALYISPEMLAGTLEIKNVPLPPIAGLPGVILSDDYTIEMAVGLEPPSIDVGMMGSFSIGHDKPDHGEFTLLMTISDGVPTPVYIRFAADKLTIWSMFEATTGFDRIDHAIEDGLNKTLPDAAPNKALHALLEVYENLRPIFDAVSLNDVAFHWCDTPVVLPDGSSALPGVGFKGRLHLFGFDLYAAFDFSSGVTTHFAARLEMEPINLGGILKVTGDGKGLLHSEIAAIKVVASKAPPVPDGYALEPGGPVFLVNSRRSPFLHASMHVDLFGVLHIDVTADADMHGMRFKLDTELLHAVRLIVEAKLSRDGTAFTFDAHGSLATHINAELSIPLPGPLPDLDISIDGGFDADVSIRLIVDAKGSETFEMQISGNLEFEGAHLPIPTLHLTKSFNHLDDLPGLLISHIDDLALEIFADLITDLDNIGKLADAAANLMIAQAEARVKLAVVASTKAVELATNGASLAMHEAEKDITAATETMTAAADAVDKAVGAEIADVKKETEAAAGEIKAVATTALRKADALVNTLTLGALDAIPGLNAAAERVVGEAIEAAAAIVEGALTAVADLAHAATVAFDTIMQGMEETVKALTKAADFIFDQINAGMHWIGGKFVDAANVIGKGFHEAWDWTKGALNSVADFFGL